MVKTFSLRSSKANEGLQTQPGTQHIILLRMNLKQVNLFTKSITTDLLIINMCEQFVFVSSFL